MLFFTSKYRGENNIKNKKIKEFYYICIYWNNTYF